MVHTPHASPERLDVSDTTSFVYTYLERPGAHREEGTPMERRSIRENNAALFKVFTESDTLGKLIAKTRWMGLHLNREDFAALMGLSKGTPLKVELLTDRSDSSARTHHQTFARIVHVFEQSNIDPRVIRAILDELLGEDRGTTIGLQREWMYRSGLNPKEFADRTGLTYGGLWQRRAQGAIPSFSELLSTIRSLGYLQSQKPEDLWRHPQVRRALECYIRDGQRIGRSGSVSTFHALLACHGKATDGPSIKKIGSYELTWDIADTLATFGLPSWFAVNTFHPLAERVMTPTEFNTFKKTWQQEYQSLKSRETYASVFKRLQEERDITNNKLARVCGITVPRPSSVIREVVDGQIPGFNHPVSRGQLAVLLHQSLEGKEIDRLRALDTSERNAKRDRQSSTVHRDMRNVREWWGLKPEDIQHRTGYSTRELLALERSPSVDRDLRTDLIDAIEKEGRRRAALLLAKWQTYQEPPTVEEAITLRAEDSGGFEALARIIKPGIPSPVSPDGLKRMISSPPPLPLLKHIVETSGARMTDSLRQDWSISYAEHLQGEGNTPLVRVLKSIIAENFVTIRSFSASPTARAHRIHQTSITRFFQKANTAPNKFDPSYALQILHGAGVAKDTPRFRWIECLMRHNEVEKALQYWICMVDVSPPLSFKDLPGLTAAEFAYAELLLSTRKRRSEQPRQQLSRSAMREQKLWVWLQEQNADIVAWRGTTLQKMIRKFIQQDASDAAIKSAIFRELDILNILFSLKPTDRHEQTVFESYIDGSIRLEAERLRSEGKGPADILEHLHIQLARLIDRHARFAASTDQEPTLEPIKMNPSDRVHRKKASY